jgi:serine/threonine protein kinase
MLVTLTTRDGTTDEDWERLDELEQAWMEERIEENALEYLEWGSECQDRLDEGKYKQGRELGAGTFGRVVLLEDEEQGGTLVAKFQTHRGKMTDPKNLETEAGNYEKIGPHPNIVRCLGVMDVDGEQALVLDSVAGGSWSSYIQDGARWVQEGKISPVEYAAGLQQILRGLVRGLVHMHGKGWHHNDIKPDNVMIDPRTGEAVIIDLGTMYSSGFLHQTPAYRDGSSRGTSDREGVGMSTFEAIVGALPNFRPERMEEDPNDFQSRGFQAKRNFWERQERMFELGKGDDPRSGLVQMIGAMHDFANRLMDPDPQKRPALGELLHLPFLTDSILSEEESRDVLKRMPDLRGN